MVMNWFTWICYIVSAKNNQTHVQTAPVDLLYVLQPKDLGEVTTCEPHSRSKKSEFKDQWVKFEMYVLVILAWNTKKASTATYIQAIQALNSYVCSHLSSLWSSLALLHNILRSNVSSLVNPLGSLLRVLLSSLHFTVRAKKMFICLRGSGHDIEVQYKRVGSFSQVQIEKSEFFKNLELGVM